MKSEDGTRKSVAGRILGITLSVAATVLLKRVGPLSVLGRTLKATTIRRLASVGLAAFRNRGKLKTTARLIKALRSLKKSKD
jgi:hypothetical protein